MCSRRGSVQGMSLHNSAPTIARPRLAVDLPEEADSCRCTSLLHRRGSPAQDFYTTVDSTSIVLSTILMATWFSGMSERRAEGAGERGSRRSHSRLC